MVSTTAKAKTVTAPGPAEKPLSFVFSFLGKKCKAALKEHLPGSAIATYPYVMSLICSNRQITQQQLVKDLDIDKATVVRIIDFLVQNKLVKRSVNPDDRRAQIIEPTARALKLLPGVESAFAKTQALALQGFTRAETALLGSLLGRIQVNLGDVAIDDNQ